jgi:hypothetical protein
MWQQQHVNAEKVAQVSLRWLQLELSLAAMQLMRGSRLCVSDWLNVVWAAASAGCSGGCWQAGAHAIKILLTCTLISPVLFPLKRRCARC